MRMLARSGAGLAEVRRIASLVGTPDGLEDFIRGRFFYRDEREEIVRTVPHMLHSLQVQGFVEGDCDDISTFLASVLVAMGVPARFVAIRYGGSEDFLHVFVEFRWEWSWIRLDPTVPRGTIHAEDERMIVNA